MDKGVTCEHLNKLAEFLGKDLWQSKESLTCFECGCSGPNLWICLQPDCQHVGCSEVRNDHSTLHQKSNPSHCVHMNVSTERVWCYACEKEVHVRAAVAYSRTSPDSTAEGALGDELHDDDTECDDDERPRGLVGLQNLGNTCYMNAALQALSNTAPFTSYFLECAAAVSVLAGDKKPGLSRAYQKLIKEMWSRKTGGYLVPSGIIYGIRNVHPMFRGYQQHDTQEFLRCFMDQLHEELKEPVWDRAAEQTLGADADGDHQGALGRRRAASSGASDAPFFARMRRKSPAASSYSESRTDGYLRVAQEGVTTGKHRRSASFAGTQHTAYAAQAHHRTPFECSRDAGSDSSLSCSSETEEHYETCSSGASDSPDPPLARPPPKSCGGGDGGGARYRSIVSDVFDGKLLSSVQCLICDRVSTRVETFQDLSLPIPSRDHLAVLRAQPPSDLLPRADTTQHSWVWWALSWLRSWLYGPAVSLQDCLAAFFSADELKGDNMYSCSRCKKLRNGVKRSGVVRLPEVLCVHLKRFRHELMFSAKVAASVSFPAGDLSMAPYTHKGTLHLKRSRHELMFSAKVAASVSFPAGDLSMAPYTHKECTSKITRYSLCAVICHTGTAGGGHYTCVARNPRGWYTFDDQSVTPLAAPLLHHTEAYVLFYRKVNPQMTVLRQKAAEIMESTSVEPNDIKFYISKQWINKFNTWAEPGPIDNGDFVCAHGGLRPERARHLPRLAALVPQPLWEFLYSKFGGGPAVSHAHECGECALAALRLRTRRARELRAFYELHAIFQEQDRPLAIYAISMHWFRQWQAFVRDRTQAPPPPVDNSGIVTKQEVEGVTTYVLKPGSDHAQLSAELWRFFTDTYGGGPEVRLRTPPHFDSAPPQARKHSHSDREDYCSKSTSETNIRDTCQPELQKNISLQNLRQARARTDSDEDVRAPYKRYEPNGNYPDSDEGMDATPRDFVSAVKLENGVDGGERGANDDPACCEREAAAEVELPNLDGISLKSKPSKTGKVRKMKKICIRK